MAGIDGVTHFYMAGLDVSGGELAEEFAGRKQVGGASLRPARGENCAGHDCQVSVTLNQNEAFVRRDGSDSADEFRGLGGGLCLGWWGFGGLEHSAGGERRAGAGTDPKHHQGFHGISLAGWR